MDLNFLIKIHIVIGSICDICSYQMGVPIFNLNDKSWNYEPITHWALQVYTKNILVLIL